MRLSLPEDWAKNPPSSLVVGGSPYGFAFAATLGAGFLNLATAKIESGNRVSLRVLEELRYLFLVLNESDSASNAIQCHRAAWGWIEKLTSAGAEHDIITLFVLPSHDSGHIQSALSTWLCVSAERTSSVGFGFWRRSSGLADLSELIEKIQPKDLLGLRARQARDSRYASVQKLRTAVTSTDSVAAIAAARELCAAFDGKDYLLDMFCRPPSHSHGNLLRNWLKTTVTDSITPDWNTAKQQLNLWLQ